MEENPKPTRRLFRFSLRTMLVLVTLVCIFCGYLGWAMNWIRQRHNFLEFNKDQVCTRVHLIGTGTSVDFEPCPAPWPLRCLGEVGITRIGWEAADSKMKRDEQLESLQELFPESKVHLFFGDSQSVFYFK